MTDAPPAAPVALTAGEPAGIGPEIAAAAWASLRGGSEPFFWIGDPAHLPPDTPVRLIDAPAESAARALENFDPLDSEGLAGLDADIARTIDKNVAGRIDSADQRYVGG